MGEELEHYSPSGFIERALHKVKMQSNVILELNLPASLYFRAEILCEDIQDLSGIEFTHRHLLNILFHDFLVYVQKNPNPKELYHLLLQRNPVPAPIKPMKLIHDGQELLLDVPKKVIQSPTTSKMKTLRYEVKRKLALRGEVVLADIAEIYPQHPFTLEKVLEILYIDFIDKFKKGEKKDAIVNILDYLES